MDYYPAWARTLGDRWLRHGLRGSDRRPYGRADDAPGAAANGRPDDVAHRGHGGPSSGEPGVAGSSPVAQIALIDRKPTKIAGTIKDLIEINNLTMLQDKHAVLARQRIMQEAGMDRLARQTAELQGLNGMSATATAPGTSASTSSAREDEMGINNRCVTNNYSYEGLPPDEHRRTQDNGLSAWILMLLIAGMLGLAAAWWIYTHQTQPVPSPSPQPAPAPVAPGTKEYLEIRKIP